MSISLRRGLPIRCTAGWSASRRRRQRPGGTHEEPQRPDLRGRDRRHHAGVLVAQVRLPADRCGTRAQPAYGRARGRHPWNGENGGGADGHRPADTAVAYRRSRHGVRRSRGQEGRDAEHGRVRGLRRTHRRDGDPPHGPCADPGRPWRPGPVRIRRLWRLRSAGRCGRGALDGPRPGVRPGTALHPRSGLLHVTLHHADRRGSRRLAADVLHTRRRRPARPDRRPGAGARARQDVGRALLEIGAASVRPAGRRRTEAHRGEELRRRRRLEDPTDHVRHVGGTGLLPRPCHPGPGGELVSPANGTSRRRRLLRLTDVGDRHEPRPRWGIRPRR
jgi:hypothetical protein